MAVRGQRTILVWDRTGKVFTALRRAAIGVPLWRVTERPTGTDLAQVDLAIATLHPTTDWRTIAGLCQEVPTVIISATGERRDAVRALSVGAFGYLDRGLSARALRRAIRGAMRGEPAYSRAVLGERIRAEIGTSASRATRALALTPRQREVVALVATGASDKEIGVTLEIG